MASGHKDDLMLCWDSLGNSQKGNALFATSLVSRPCSRNLSALPTSVKIRFAPYFPLLEALSIILLAML